MPEVDSFNYMSDLPSAAGKTFVITGGTSGVGQQAVVDLAKKGAEHIIFTGRNEKSAQETLSQAKESAPSTKVEFLPMDQSSLASVRDTADAIASKLKRIDVLIANGGVSGGAALVSKDGYEINFAINHLSHALLAQKLLPLLQKTASTTGDARFVSLSSLAAHAGQGFISFDDLNTSQDWSKDKFGEGRVVSLVRYGQSKLAIALYTKVLAKREPEILSVALHPGAIKTPMVQNATAEEAELISNLGMTFITVPQGAYNTLWNALIPKDKLENGGFTIPVGEPGPPAPFFDDEALQTKLWDYTQKAIGPFL